MKLDKETTFILGRPNFWCGNIAMFLRNRGHVINQRAEDEQAYVINFMLEMYEEHGDEWRRKFEEYLR